MRRSAILTMLGVAALLSVSALAAGSGDVIILLNSGDNVAYIGETNEVEIWVRNDELLTEMTLGFQFRIGLDHSFVLDGGYHNGSFHFTDQMIAAFDDVIWQHHTTGYWEGVHEFGFSGHAGVKGLTPNSAPVLAATFKVDIAPEQPELANGFVIDNVNMWIGALNNRFMEWQFADVQSVYAPDYNGVANRSIDEASAPAQRFHIINRNRGQCCNGQVGDVNGSGQDTPTIGDVATLIDHLFITGGRLFCVAEADINRSGGAEPKDGQGGDISISDISMLIDHLFISRVPLPTCF